MRLAIAALTTNKTKFKQCTETDIGYLLSRKKKTVPEENNNNGLLITSVIKRPLL